ncbi:MAG: PDZ domain-containing protein, partial [Candidatus Hydrogenedentes bacterium]|nr:PDZ domain-containing protein [Candidatus Hydrogenedentota bacterium]
CLAALAVAMPAWCEDTDETLRASVERAVSLVKPALVRVEVVSTYYSEGREQKYESSGSGVIISEQGHVVTNHHVAGHSARLVCTLATKEEVEAELVGRDPLTDIAVLKLLPETERSFPVARFGDSSQVRVGDQVLAMGSPMSLSQSVTLGIVSNVELVLPEWMSRWGSFTEDGEDVGALVRWLAHDAEIYGGNSGGPLVNLSGEIVGINEIKIGLSGAIPGNLVRAVTEELIARGEVRRAWLGIRVQPQFKHRTDEGGLVIASVISGSPADKAGVKPGDILVRLGSTEVSVRFAEQLPAFNQLEADLAIGEPVPIVVRRAGEEKQFEVAPVEREEVLPQETEFRQWGITSRDISLLMAKEMKRESREGVLVTSVNAGGPAGSAKPMITRDDVIVQVNDTPVACVQDLRDVTAQITEGQSDPTPALVHFERKSERFVTVVEVGIKELEDPGLEVKKAWLPVQTQVLTRDIVEQVEQPDLTGFRITQVFPGSTAEKAGLKVGDFILAVDDEELTASAPEDYEQLEEWIRQYRIGDTAELLVLRGTERIKIPVELVRSPKLSREMPKYRNESFEFTCRDITFFDKAREKWEQAQAGVLVQEVESGGWAALGMLEEGDLLIAVDGTRIADVKALEERMLEVEEAKPKAIVFQVLRGIHSAFLEIEPNWEPSQDKGKE